MASVDNKQKVEKKGSYWLGNGCPKSCRRTWFERLLDVGVMKSKLERMRKEVNHQLQLEQLPKGCQNQNDWILLTFKIQQKKQ